MRYCIQISIKKLLYNYKKYLAITIQYALGICLIFLSLNMQFCAEYELISAKSNTAINLIRIVGEMTQSDFQAAYVNVDSSNQVDVIYYRDIYFQVYKDNRTHIIHAYFVDDLFYKYIVGSDAIDLNIVYAGKNALSILKSANLDVDEYSERYFDIKSNTIFGIDINTIQELKNFRYVMPPMEYEMMMDQNAGNTPTFDDSIFIPIKRLSFPDDPLIASKAYVVVNDESSAYAENYCLEFCKALKDINPEIEYSYNYINGWTMGRFIELKNNALHLQIISTVTFVIILITLTRIILLTINKRKRDMSISIVCGAEKKVVFLEIFCEIAYILIFGLLLGIIIGFIILHLQLIPNQVTHIYLLSYIICIAITIALNSIVCFTALFSIRNLSPLETIHEQ